MSLDKQSLLDYNFSMKREEIQTKIDSLKKEIQTIRNGLILSKMNFDDGQEFRRENQEKFATDTRNFLNQELRNKAYELDELSQLLNPQQVSRRRFK